MVADFVFKAPQPQQPTASPKPDWAQDPNRTVSLEEFEEIVRDHHGIPKGLWQAISAQESGGDVNAVSPTNVRGKWQMTKATAKIYGLDRDDPYEQATAAARHLRAMFDASAGIKNEGARWLASAAKYYGGDDAVDSSGNLSTFSKDKLSNPAAYAESIARRWAQFERESMPAPGVQQTDRQSSATPSASPVAPSTVAPSPAPQQQTRSLSKRDQMRRQAVESAVQEFEQLKAAAANLVSSPDERRRAVGFGLLDRANKMAAGIGRRASDLVEVGGTDQWAYIKPRAGFSYRMRPDPVISAAIRTRPEEAQQIQTAQAKKDAYAQKSALGQTLEDVTVGTARAGELFTRGIRQAIELPAKIAVPGAPGIETARGREAREYTAQRLAEREAAAPSDLSAIRRGITTGLV